MLALQLARTCLHVPHRMGLTTQKFDILTRIAIGNGALVYRGVEKTTLRQVALKLLTQDGEIDHRFDLDALFADVPRIKSIYGAHVCQLLDAYPDDDGPVLVYEFVNGLNGAQFPMERKLEPVQALDVAAQLISALRSGERQRMPHSDLKPSNIIFVDLPDKRPFTFVLDWGLAAYRTALSDDSLAYLAPERLAGGPPSHAADLFAAGAVLFYLYTGKVLVGGGSREQVAAAWTKVRPGVLAELRPDLSPKLVQWVCGLLELDPAKRPPSAVEASTVLATLNPPPPAAPPESIRPRPVSAMQPAPAPRTPSAPPSSPPSSVAAPRSGVRPAPSVNVPTPRIIPKQAGPVKKSVVPTILLSTLIAASLAGGGWYWMRSRDKQPVEEPGALADARPARTPSPSVTAPVPQAPLRALPNSVEPAKHTTAVAQQSKPPDKKPAPTVAKTSAAPAKPAKAGTGKGKGYPKDEEGFVASESFSYGGGSALAGLNGGQGWAGPWAGPPAKIDAASLTYPEQPSTGGSMSVGDASDELVWTRQAGPANRFIRQPEKGGRWYFGALVDPRNAIPGTSNEIQINPFNTTDIYALFRIVVVTTPEVFKVTLNTQKAVEFKNEGKPLCIVLRVDAKNPKFDNYDFTAQLWVNPSFSGISPPAVPTIQVERPGQPMPKQVGVMIRKKRGQVSARVDELRYALHWKAISFQEEGEDND